VVVGADWSHRGEYMFRKHGITTEVADEALDDPDRVVLDPDPSSESGRSVRVIGYSPSAAALITVITLDDEGTTYGVNGWRSENTDRRRYREGSA
jgi:uncharacterized DUF497 family protein